MEFCLFENYIGGRWRAPVKGTYLEMSARAKGVRAGRVPRSKAEAEIAAICRTIVPILLQGHPVVILLLYQSARSMPVRLLALLGLMASHLPPGVLNLLTGLGLEAGLALERSPRAELVASKSSAFARETNPSLESLCRPSVF